MAEKEENLASVQCYSSNNGHYSRWCWPNLHEQLHIDFQWAYRLCLGLSDLDIIVLKSFILNTKPDNKAVDLPTDLCFSPHKLCKVTKTTRLQMIFCMMFLCRSCSQDWWGQFPFSFSPQNVFTSFFQSSTCYLQTASCSFFYYTALVCLLLHWLLILFPQWL